MIIKIQIPTPPLMEGLPAGTSDVEVEVISPAEVFFEMHRRGCDKAYIQKVLEHLGQVWADDFPNWYGETASPDAIRDDLAAVHPNYRHLTFD